MWEPAQRAGGPELATLWLPDLERAAAAALGSGGDAEGMAALAGLEALGTRCAGAYLRLAREAGRDPPTLERYDAWGRRVDRLRTGEAWRALKRAAAAEGIVADGYGPAAGPERRVRQFLKVLLFSASSGMVSCPMAMTDGCASVMRQFAAAGDEECLHVFDRLTSRDPGEAWTSGQWMTEIAGGSDVARATQTVVEARAGLPGGGSHELTGLKWFSSATDSQVALTLARECGADRCDRHLSMFLVRVPEHVGGAIRCRRLKDKLGTRQLPTGELELHACPARRLGPPGRGIQEISRMMNLTRVHNSASAASHARLMWLLCARYAEDRSVQGRPLGDHALAAERLAWMEAAVGASVALTLDCAALLGRAEDGPSGAARAEAEGLLRLMTPASKLLTAKLGVSVCTEGIEFFGGAGYVEDAGVATILRDCLVLPIWEGCSNVQALDVLRVAGSEAGRAALDSVLDQAGAAAAAARPPLGEAAEGLRRSADGLRAAASRMLQAPARRDAELLSYGVAQQLSRVRAGTRLLEQASRSAGDAAAAVVATRWCRGAAGRATAGEGYTHYEPTARL